MRIGTRGSALALAQAAWVAERLGADSELVTITTSGDRDAGRGVGHSGSADPRCGSGSTGARGSTRHAEDGSAQADRGPDRDRVRVRRARADERAGGVLQHARGRVCEAGWTDARAGSVGGPS